MITEKETTFTLTFQGMYKPLFSFLIFNLSIFLIANKVHLEFIYLQQLTISTKLIFLTCLISNNPNIENRQVRILKSFNQNHFDFTPYRHDTSSKFCNKKMLLSSFFSFINDSALKNVISFYFGFFPYLGSFHWISHPYHQSRNIRIDIVEFIYSNLTHHVI